MKTSTPTAIAQDWLAALDKSLANRDEANTLKLFGDDCFWRDLLAFTWNIRTLEGRDAIAAMLRETQANTAPGNWVLDGEPSESNGVMRPGSSLKPRRGVVVALFA